ncbi:hypothetical protein [Denitromonas halophila]|uniref:Uncharacterized protein n=1 Tax=Denitromonas halophila TaxID=1629404 RepID=A0A557QR19_9RHOO|nr:hypothetical protein [Denitromonas halophila]TVO55358.1 hypothetical protein FHP91_12840 [Denitromonas halophila]
MTEEEILRKKLFDLLDAAYQWGCLSGVFDYDHVEGYKPLAPDERDSGEVGRAMLKLQRACKAV